ncbi:heparinase II/III family protein [Vibrio vulnificus]|nr:heparinase II/III family protein [Vibrio vulnificus]
MIYSIAKKILRVNKEFKRRFFDQVMRRKLYKFEIDVSNVIPPKVVFDEGLILQIIGSHDKNQIIRTADYQLEGKYYIYRYEIVNIGEEVSKYFSFDYINKYLWDSDIYYRDTVLRPSESADIKVPWEFSRLHQLVVFSIAYYLTGEVKYKEAMIRHLKIFINSNPPMKGINWYYSMEVSIRLTNMILALDICSARDNEQIELIEIESYIRYSISHMMCNVEWRGGIRNNHYFVGLFGLLYASLRYSKDDDYSLLASFANKEINCELNVHILDDGGGAELSTGYHKLNIESLLYFLRVRETHKEILKSIDFIKVLKLLFKYPMCPIELKLRSDDSKSDYFIRVNKAIKFFKSISTSDGEFPLIGDNDSGRIIKLCPLVSGKKMSWSNFNHLLGFDNILKVDESADFITLSTLDNEVVNVELQSMSLLFNHVAKDVSYRYFPSFGLLVVKGDGLFMTIKTSCQGRIIPGHHHDDILSITLNLNGEWLYQDNGTYSYNQNRKCYLENKKNTNHNVSCEDEPDFVFIDDVFGTLNVRSEKKLFFTLIKNNSGVSLYCARDLVVENKNYYPDYYMSLI